MSGLPDQIQVALFDLDGVLTPTALVHANAWAQMFDQFLRRHGQRPFDPISDYEQYVDGKPRMNGVRDFLKSRGIELPEGDPDDPPELETAQGLGARKDRLFTEKIAKEGVEPYPGSVRYLKAIRASGMRTAVVSASRHCAAIVHAAGLDDLLDVRVDGMVAAERGLRGKPQPDTFLEAARRLRTPPERAVVFEDAVAGVEAGHAGHFGYVVGVNRMDQPPSHEHADALRANGANMVVTDLAELLQGSGDGSGT